MARTGKKSLPWYVSRFIHRGGEAAGHQNDFRDCEECKLILDVVQRAAPDEATEAA